MKADGEFINNNKLKLLLWSVSAGTVVAFFFASNFLKFATGFSLSGEILFISPLFCGFILGLLTTMDELYHSVIAAIILTITAVALIILALFAPVIFGVSGDFIGLYYVFVIQNMLISIVLIFPVALVMTITGKVAGEYLLLGHIYKAERMALKSDTVKWYQMLEEAAGEQEELKPIGWKPENDVPASRTPIESPSEEQESDMSQV